MSRTLSERAVGQLKEDHRLLRQMVGGVENPRRDGLRQALLEGFLIDALDAAENVLTEPATAELMVLRHTGPFFEDPIDNDLKAEADLVITVVNRSHDRHADSGTYCVVAWINAEWRPIELDCTASDEGIDAVMSATGGTLGGGTLGS